MKKLIETWAPVFPGFYNTVFEFNDEQALEYALPEEWSEWLSACNNPDDFYRVDYPRYCLDVCGAVCESLEYSFKDIPGFSALKMQEMRSPKEYNFTNDAINIEIDFSDFEAFRVWWLAYIDEHEATWSDYLKGRYTHRDGFYSSYSNDPEEWARETGNYTEIDNHYLGAMLQFYCELEGIEAICIYQDIADDLNESEYVETKLPFPDDDGFEELQEKIGRIQKAIETGEKQFAQYADTMPTESVERQRAGHLSRIGKLNKEAVELLTKRVA